ncbi:MAG: hypothetical protein ACE5LV_03790 [Candidatus Aminicenantales bacterium]
MTPDPFLPKTLKHCRLDEVLGRGRMAAALSHPPIAQVYDIDTVEESTVFGMENGDGCTFREMLRETGAAYVREDVVSS